MRVHELSTKSVTVTDVEIDARSLYLLAAPAHDAVAPSVIDAIAARSDDGRLSHAEDAPGRRRGPWRVKLF